MTNEELLEDFSAGSIVYKIVSAEEFTAINPDLLNGKCLYVCFLPGDNKRRVKAAKPSNVWSLLQ